MIKKREKNIKALTQNKIMGSLHTSRNMATMSNNMAKLFPADTSGPERRRHCAILHNMPQQAAKAKYYQCLSTPNGKMNKSFKMYALHEET